MKKTSEQIKALQKEATIDQTIWEKEIEIAHPIINHYPKDQWARVARFNGWLPFPPPWLI